MSKINDYISHGELHTFMHSGKLGMKWGFTNGAKNGNPTAGDFRKAEAAFDKKKNREKSAANKYAELATAERNKVNAFLQAERDASDLSRSSAKKKADQVALDRNIDAVKKDGIIVGGKVVGYNSDGDPISKYKQADGRYYKSSEPTNEANEYLKESLAKEKAAGVKYSPNSNGSPGFTDSKTGKWTAGVTLTQYKKNAKLNTSSVTNSNFNKLDRHKPTISDDYKSELESNSRKNRF